MTNYEVVLVQNPWNHRIANASLYGILSDLADSCARRIVRNLTKAEGEDVPPSFAFVILDPTAPASRHSEETIIAIISIGPDGDSMVHNAIAKAFYHRDHGQMAGYGAYVDPLTSADGDFAWGYSTQVDNTIGGGSGQTQEEDAYLVGSALVTFNYRIRFLLKNWFDANVELGVRPDWYCNNGKPGVRYTDAARSAINGSLHVDSYTGPDGPN